MTTLDYMMLAVIFFVACGAMAVITYLGDER